MAARQYVLPTGHFSVKSGAQLKQCQNAARRLNPAAGGFEHAGQYLEQRALARTIPADDPKAATAPDCERYVLQRPNFRRAAFFLKWQPIESTMPWIGVEMKALCHAFHRYRPVRSHNTSRISSPI